MDYRITNDGSKTLFSSKYNQTFHSIQDGALSEALHKHILPAFALFEKVEKLHILDICFGLGYNTFGTIYHLLENNLTQKVKFYSPEFDETLISSLKGFEYPEQFSSIKHIINELSENKYYKDEQFEIELYIGDARGYIQQLSQIDIIYQDPFSSDINKELWTKEYFFDIAKICSRRSVITTYSIASPVRMSIYENNFYIYEYQSNTKKKSTIASNFKIESDSNIEVKWINMEKKQLNSPNAISLSDYK
jgi:tRNA U34 5-methylaminomethyl-2-thiouridine-forming methyltransferase MnmC